MSKEGIEVKEEGEKNNPYEGMTDYEKRLMQKMGGIEEGEEEEAEEVVEEAEEDAGEEQDEEGEEETAKRKEDETKEIESKRKDKMRRDLEDALYAAPTADTIDRNEADMTDVEKQLSAQLKAERFRNSKREENDELVKMLETYTKEESDILVPEIRKFLGGKVYKLLSSLTAKERAGTSLTLARGLIAEKLQATAEQRGAAKTEAKQKMEALSGGPKKKTRKIESSTKEVAALRKAAAMGDRRAAQKLAGMNDSVLDGIIKRSGGA